MGYCEQVVKPGSKYIDLVLKGGIEIVIPEPPAEMIRDLKIYYAEIPNGQAAFDSFIDKLLLGTLRTIFKAEFHKEILIAKIPLGGLRG